MMGGDNRSTSRTQPFTVRTLVPTELGRWADFVADCFCEKDPPPPASHFADHVRNDPTFHADCIVVACDADGRYVGTARAFIRQQRTDAAPEVGVRIGGVAEVCIRHDWRGRGVLGMIFLALDRFMEQQQCKHTLLHCAPGLIRVYRRLGYSSVETPWATLGAEALAAAASGPAATRVLRGGLPRHAVKGRPGTIVRDSAYILRWWLPAVAALETWETADSFAALKRTRGNEEGGHVLADFYAADPAAALGSLSAALVADGCASLRVPQWVADAAAVPRSSVSTSVDLGWMVRDVGWSGERPAFGAGHCFWPVDSF